MDDKGPRNAHLSRRDDNMEDQKSDNNQGDIDDPVKASQPKPADFDVFLPWACEQFSIERAVIVTRAAQKVYVSTEKKKQQMKRKQSTIIKASTVPQERPMDVDHADQSSSLKSFALPFTEDSIKIETVYDTSENLVQLNFLNNRQIPRKIMQVIALTLPYQIYLTSININGGLRMDTLYEMSKFLTNSQITEICLDGSFLREANYHVLLTHEKLKHLSLSRCTINDAVVKTITDQLKYPSSTATGLSALNLSTNKITDMGAKYLADMLRGNRQLGYLNLAGNMITDEGGMTILDTLQKFPLQLQEISASRAKYVAYLKNKNAVINAFVQQLSLKYQIKKKSGKKVKRDSQNLQLGAYEANIIQERAECLAETEVGSFTDPFSLNNTETQDGVVHCFGNNTLCYLNLAYNNLSYVSLKKLLEVLIVQAAFNRTPKGLIKVVIEGNLMPEVCEEFKEIENLLRADRKRLKSQSDNVSRKKSMSAKSTYK